MSFERRIATCINCGDEREIAAHGLCFKCYRASERAAENPWAAADRHNRAKVKAQRKLRTAITTILNAVDGVIEFMDEEHVETIRGVCGHYFLGLASGLPPAPAKTVGDVNSERNDAVNCSLPKVADSGNTEHQSGVPSPDDTGEVNSEHDAAVNCSPEATASELIRPEPKDIECAADCEATSPLIKGRRYEVRLHPLGGFGVYEDGSPTCLQWHDDLDAWDAVIAVTNIPEEAIQEALEGI